MNTEEIVKYYNKFTEDKRLQSRHGQVEFSVTMEYLKHFLPENSEMNILDVGAGTGKYSFALSDMGHKVTAVELVKYNLGILKSKGSNVNAVQGDARNLKKFSSDSFDVVLLFGPMYHLLSFEDKLAALLEAKRVAKNGGLIFISYIMNDYAIILHGFRDCNIIKSLSDGRVDEKFNIIPDSKDLYSYVRIEEIDKLKESAGLHRELIVAQDGPTDYMRSTINKMDEDEFNLFIQYVKSIAQRPEMLGSSSHVMDILRVKK